MRTLIILLLCTNTSFAIAQISPKAVEKNNQSVKTAGFFNDSDSLNKAIHLSDEAIALEPSYKLAYANKIKYLMALGQKEKALQTMLQMEKLIKATKASSLCCKPKLILAILKYTQHFVGRQA